MRELDIDIIRRITYLERAIDNLVQPEITGGSQSVLSWTAWTPTVTQSSALTVTVNSGAFYAKYAIIESVAFITARLSIGSAGTVANAIVIGGAPAAIQPSNNGDDTYAIGTCMIKDNMSAYYGDFLVAVGATDWRIIQSDYGNYCGIDPAFALASGDEITFFGMYEVA